MTRSADEARDVHPAFVGVALAVEHAAVVTRLLRTVVGEENHDGVLGEGCKNLGISRAREAVGSRLGSHNKTSTSGS